MLPDSSKPVSDKIRTVQYKIQCLTIKMGAIGSHFLLRIKEILC